MFENSKTLISALNNPMQIAAMTLNELENRLGGTRIIADPNSAFCHLLEFGSSIAAGVINSTEDRLTELYPKRAESAEDLYNHMSDFDYLTMYSTPSKTMMRLTIAKQYLINNAIKYNEHYKLVRIPGDTVFYLGKYVFGIHYPINILINNYTDTFTVVYDTTNANPLHSLTTNVVDKYDLSYRGLDYLVIDFPIYQFAKSTITETLIAETGFVKKISFNNDFYAIRLFSYSNGKYTELSQSQSEIVYDAEVPTALVRVYPDDKLIKLTIPQIYFDKNMLGSKLLIEVYTTLGELDINTSNITADNIGVAYRVGEREDGTYSGIFQNLPFDSILTISADVITGGSDAISVAELRERVVNNALYEQVPITEKQLTTMLKDNGFYVKKALDNITDRNYYAYRVLNDGNGSVISSLNIPLRLKLSYATDNEHAPFLYFNSDNSITILPSALYHYDQDSNTAVPLTNTEMTAIAAMSKEALANEFNNNQYLRSPFHMRVSVNDTYPSVVSYDLYNPEVKRVQFDVDNYEMSEKIIMFSASIAHDAIRKYTVVMSVTKSDELKDLDESRIKIYVEVKTNSNMWVGTTAEYVSTDEATGRYNYKFEIPTDYHISENDELGVTFDESEYGDVVQRQDISLVHDFHVIFMVDRSFFPYESVVEPTHELIEGVPSKYTSVYLGLSRQHLTIELGKSLRDVINNNMDVSVTKTVYETYESDVMKRYPEDVYERDENGQFVTVRDDEGNFALVKLHSLNDIVTDKDGNIEYLHKAGDIKLDVGGLPVVSTSREPLYYVDAMFLDAKLYLSDRAAEVDFQNNLYRITEGYFDTIRSIQDQLLERTHLFFKCVRSTGLATINRGDGISEKQNIEMSFNIVCYVPSYVKKSESIQQQITEMTCTAIEEALNSRVVSMLDIFAQVKEKMVDYIDHFDLLGINGDSSLQTFIIEDEDAQPSIARKLVLTSDNVLSLNKQVKITYVALNSNTDSVTELEVGDN